MHYHHRGYQDTQQQLLEVHDNLSNKYHSRQSVDLVPFTTIH